MDRVIGSYRVGRRLGEGGMGAVYEAVHTEIGRRAAIKILHPEHARNVEISRRFINEARAVNLVQHPGIVNIYEVGRLPEGGAFLIMEYLAGETLRERLARVGRMGIGGLRIARQIAAALAAAHEVGIVHGFSSPQGFTVLKGATVVKDEHASLEPYYRHMRKELLRIGIFADSDDHYELSADYLFVSATMAAGILLGRRANGRVLWRTADGLSLKSMLEAGSPEDA